MSKTYSCGARGIHWDIRAMCLIGAFIVLTAAAALAARYTPKLLPPTTPTGLTAIAQSPTQVSLSWKDTSSSETGFTIERASSATGAFTKIKAVAANSTGFTDPSATSGTTLYYRVASYNSTSVSSYVGPVPVIVPPVIPAAPTNLAAEASSSSLITLRWTDASSNETSFKVERSTSASGPFSVITSTVGVNAITYSDSGLTASTAYYYKVSSVNSAGSAASNLANTTTLAATGPAPTAPTALVVTPTRSDTIRLTWTDTSTVETGFRVMRAASTLGPFVEVGQTTANVQLMDNTGLLPSTKYYYKVCAFNAVGNSSFAGPKVTTTQAPAVEAPTNALAQALAPTRVRVSWKDNSTTELAFRLFRTNVGVGTRNEIIVNAGATEYVDTSVSSNTDYKYEVGAVGSSGDSLYVTTTCRTPPPVSIEWLSEAPGIGEVSTAVLAGNVLYATSRLGLHIIDVTNLAKPLIKQTVPMYGAMAIAVDPDSSRVCVAETSGITVVDGKTGAVVESIHLGFRPQDMTIRDGFLFAACANLGVAVKDLNLPSAFVMAPTIYSIIALDVTADWIVAADYSSNLRVLNRATGVEVFSLPVNGSLVDIKISGGYVYVACDGYGLVRLKLETNGTLRYIGHISTEGYAKAVDVVGSKSYVTVQYGDSLVRGNGVQVIDILSDGTMAISPVRLLNGPPKSTISYGSGAVCVANSSGELLLLDASSPTLTEISRLTPFD
ncbi:MAG: fibronectin type III domain-containing protein, partial [Armatimonadota bacterium]